MRSLRVLAAFVLFMGGLVLTWATQGTGVVRDDPERNISIPERLTMPLWVQAAYDDDRIFIRYRWPAERPSFVHDVLRYEDGSWLREGRDVPGPVPHYLHEDRVAMMLDDGSVPEFERYGGYVAIGAGLAGLTTEAAEEVTKYLPLTRTRLGQWDSTVPEDDRARLRAAGYFLDLWHWRSARSNPMGVADDQHVAAERGSDAGRASFGTNWDGETNQPRVMFDPAVAGHRALRWEDLIAGNLAQDATHALTPAVSVAYDPDAGWQNGDVLPRRMLQEPAGSRSDIRVDGRGRWSDGHWDVTLTRLLDTGSPEDDKILRDLGIYHVAFSVHRDATGGRWHYVSMPDTLGLGRQADIVATKFEGSEPVWPDTWHEVTLFYPGQVSWERINSVHHAGAEAVALGVPAKFRHGPRELAQYGIEGEFGAEIRRQWVLTMTLGVVLIAAFGFALHRAIVPAREV